MRDFDSWFDTFTERISDYRYYVNFAKVYKNVERLRVDLCIMNSLIGSKTIKKDFFKLIENYPGVLRCIPLLLAVREMEIKIKDEDGPLVYNFEKRNLSPEQYGLFMEKTGLFDLIGNHIINNLVDYALGIETGLDSNARKNRSGELMQGLVGKAIAKAGFTKNVDYFAEMTTSEIENLFGLDMSSISNNGKMEKRFDFVVKTRSTVYGVEVNFYSSSGSKLNETARSYKQIALEARNIPGFVFVWFTDGKGWENSKNNLREAFDVMDTLYNLEDIHNGIMKQVFK